MEKKEITLFALDDDAGDLEIMSRSLEEIADWKIHFVGFQEWPQARKMLEGSLVDVIFLDYQIGNKTGLEILKEIRETGDRRPIIILTGQGNEHVAAETVLAGADDYMVKGEMTPDRLRQTINNVITQFELRKEKAIMAEELRQAQKTEAIVTLAGGIAHDFNNMLTTIRGYSELAFEESKEDGVKGELGVVLNACDQMAELVDRLMGFSRKGKVSWQEVDFREIVKETEVFLSHTLPESIDLVIEYCEEPLPIRVNVQLIQQIILNLCINGSEAMPRGGPLVIRSGKIPVEGAMARSHGGLEEGEYVLLEVQDQGRGMAPHVKKRIFEPFFTTKEMGSERGIGLGLAAAWQNVKNHGGHIEVESEVGKGSTFKVYLPMEREG